MKTELKNKIEEINKPGMYGWVIDRDYLNKKDDPCCRVGRSTSKWHLLNKDNKIRFRCLDDDGNIYFGGWMVDNDWCHAQESVLSFTMNDAGCVEVQVKRNGVWVIEICYPPIIK